MIILKVIKAYYEYWQNINNIKFARSAFIINHSFVA